MCCEGNWGTCCAQGLGIISVEYIVRSWCLCLCRLGCMREALSSSRQGGALDTAPNCPSIRWDRLFRQAGQDPRVLGVRMYLPYHVQVLSYSPSRLKSARFHSGWCQVPSLGWQLERHFSFSNPAYLVPVKRTFALPCFVHPLCVILLLISSCEWSIKGSHYRPAVS